MPTMRIFAKLRQLFTVSFYWFPQEKTAYFRIVNINLVKQEVVFQVVNKPLTITSTFVEAVGDAGVINNLSSNEACYLGGYYGRALRNSHNRSGALKQAKSQSFLLEGQGGKYQISFQNRAGEVGYFDKKTKEAFIDSPVALANNAYIISQFNACQACYVGILAGIFMEKSIELNNKVGKSMASRPALRIVK